MEQAEAERAELAHQAAELTSEQAALQEQQQEAQREHERLAALADKIAQQRAALDEQRSLILEAQEKAKVSSRLSGIRSLGPQFYCCTGLLPVSHSPTDVSMQSSLPTDADMAACLMR